MSHLHHQILYQGRLQNRHHHQILYQSRLQNRHHPQNHHHGHHGLASLRRPYRVPCHHRVPCRHHVPCLHQDLCRLQGLGRLRGLCRLQVLPQLQHLRLLRLLVLIEQIVLIPRVLAHRDLRLQNRHHPQNHRHGHHGLASLCRPLAFGPYRPLACGHHRGLRHQSLRHQGLRHRDLQRLIHLTWIR